MRFSFVASAFFRSCVTFARCLHRKNLVSNSFKARFFASCKLSPVTSLCSLKEVETEEHRLLFVVPTEARELSV
jgi:hypothetical protein